MILSWFFHKNKLTFLKVWHVTLAILRYRGKISKYPAYVLEFERDFAKYIGCKFGMSFCNGSSALEAALFAIGIGPGDEVLVSSCTVHSTAAAVISLGAQPVYVDIDPQTLNFDPAEIDKKVTERTRCVLVVHLWGNPADMGSIKEKAEKYNLKIVEDCSHAHGASIDGEKVGSIGDIGCFSLQGYKAISAGEGGVAVTNVEEYYHRLTLFGHFGRNPKAIAKTKYKELLPIGIETKRRANPLGICMAAIDLKHIEKTNKFKRRIIQQLECIIFKIQGIEKVCVLPGAEKGGFYPGYPIILKQGYNKAAVFQQLKSLLRYRILGEYPWLYNPPNPHYHKMRPMYDLNYRAGLVSGENKESDDSLSEAPMLEQTETVLERIIFFPIG